MTTIRRLYGINDGLDRTEQNRTEHDLLFFDRRGFIQHYYLLFLKNIKDEIQTLMTRICLNCLL